jgi:hypothetical protein
MKRFAENVLFWMTIGGIFLLAGVCDVLGLQGSIAASLLCVNMVWTVVQPIVAGFGLVLLLVGSIAIVKGIWEKV